MYLVTSPGLGFSLKPPKFVRDLFSNVQVTVPTPIGPLDVTSPAVLEAAKRATVTIGPGAAASPYQQAVHAVEQFPGGAAGVLAVIAGVGALAFMLGKRR